MSLEAIFVLIIAGVALVVFISEWIAPDLVGLLVLLALGISGILDLPTLFSGFSSTVVITLIGVFMLTAALHHTGVTAYVSQALLRWTQGLGERALVGVLALAAALAAIMMNNVASVALVAPIGRRVALKLDISPSRVLMPIAFGALLGGMATLLATSNLVVAGLLTERQLPSFGLLDFLPVGGPIAVVGLVYLALFSPRLLPERSPSDQWSGLQQARQELTRTYRLAVRLHEAYVRPESALAGTTLAESDLGHNYGVTVSAVVRGRQTYATLRPDMQLQAGDWLLLQGRPQETELAAQDLGLDLYDPDDGTQAVLYRTNSELAEVALSPRTSLVGQTLSEINFREKYGVNVLGVWHEGRPIRSFLSDYPLARGDALLVQGVPEQLVMLNRDPDFLVLTQLPEIPERTDHALIAVLILFAFLVTIAFKWLPVPIAALLGGVAVILTGCQSIEQARASVNWQVIFLVGGMLPLAAALEQTGAANVMAQALHSLIGGAGPRILLLAFFALTVALTQFTSGQVSPLIIGPLAISTALELGINPRTLAMAVAVGAASAFLSPVGHPANMLVMGPGGYRFGDYAKLGFALILVAVVGLYFLAPLAYPF